MAGGLVTNSNLSAAWARTLTRQASREIDAVYYNPAGLRYLENGFHFSLNNQFIFQSPRISSSYVFIEKEDRIFDGTERALLFPSFYAAYKMDRLVLSGGVNFISGGRRTLFEEGMPLFEVPVASLVPDMQVSLFSVDDQVARLTGTFPGYSNVTGYDLTASFECSKRYMGYQAGATYAVNNLLSVALGARYVSVHNVLEASRTGVTIDVTEPEPATKPPGTYIRYIADEVEPLNASLGERLFAMADELDDTYADRELKAVQKGSGITPIIGVNIHLAKKMDIGVKYEHHTRIELENETTVDEMDMFPDGAQSRGDLPGMLSVGVRYHAPATGVLLRPINKLTVNFGYDFYFDKSAWYGFTDAGGEQVNNKTTVDHNTFDLALSLEYMLMHNFGISAGYAYANKGVNDLYQSDLNFALEANTIAGGFCFAPARRLTINAGIVYVISNKNSVRRSYTLTFDEEPYAIPYTDTYEKRSVLFAVGLDVRL